MKHALLLAAVLVVLGVGSAEARTTINEPLGSHFPYQRWADAAAVPTPNAAISLLEGACPGAPQAAGCYTGAEIYVRGRGRPGVFFHELGHGFDGLHLTDWDRHRYAELIRRPLARWEPYINPAGITYLGLAEDFAQSYADCALAKRWRSPRVCRLIHNAYWY